ncbi:MAG: pyridoxamine 5'-phosphate oxidase family protein [Acidimicrobiia bacterium]|nr:pyridoxamine 5'-phosphate oxidase family protein [Acidimicrobiia bacterium]NNC75479.1 pyridoxamine 5'-phosphate oxidase family protein [Acidimicrobiia bacterium]
MDDLSQSECEALLNTALVGHLGVADDNGVPYVTPVSFAYNGSSLMLRTGPGRRLELIRAHPSVCVEVSSFDEETGDWASVILWGEAVEVTDVDRRSDVVQLLLSKYEASIGAQSWSTPDVLPGLSTVVEVSVDSMTGRRSGGGFGQKTRPGRL